MKQKIIAERTVQNEQKLSTDSKNFKCVQKKDLKLCETNSFKYRKIRQRKGKNKHGCIN